MSIPRDASGKEAYSRGREATALAAAIRGELVHARRAITALTDAVADLAELLATGGSYHA
jgi:hypothetical protein